MSSLNAVHASAEREERARVDLFSDLTPDEAQENMEAILSLTETRGWQVLQEGIRRAQQELHRELQSWTKPREQAEYAGKIGQLQGLAAVEEIVDGVLIAGTFEEE